MELNDEQRKLCEEYLDYANAIFATIITQKKFPLSVEHEDLRCAANYGLVKAALNWKKEKGLFKSYAVTVMWNTVLNECRLNDKLSQREREKVKDGLIDDIITFSWDDNPEYRQIASNTFVDTQFEQREYVQWLMECLNDEERNLIDEYYFKDAPEREIAAKNNVTRQCISLIIIRARKKMEKRIKSSHVSKESLLSSFK